MHKIFLEISERILRHSLSKSDKENSVIFTFVHEILGTSIIPKLISNLGDPDFLNQQIIYLLTPLNQEEFFPAEKILNKRPSAILELGLFDQGLNTIKKNNVKEIMADGRLLPGFIRFMKSENAFNLLEFCLMVDSYKRLAFLAKEPLCPFIENEKAASEANEIFNTFFGLNSKVKITLKDCKHVIEQTKLQIANNPSPFVFDKLLECIMVFMDNSFIDKFLQQKQNSSELKKSKSEFHYKNNCENVGLRSKSLVELSHNTNSIHYEIRKISNNLTKIENRLKSDSENLGISNSMDRIGKVIKEANTILRKTSIIEIPNVVIESPFKENLPKEFEFLRDKIFAVVDRKTDTETSTLESISDSQTSNDNKECLPNILSNAELDTILDCCFGVIEEIFQLTAPANWMRQQGLYLVKTIMRNAYGKNISDMIQSMLIEMLSEKQVSLYLDLLREALLPETPIPERTDIEKQQTREEAKTLLLNASNDTLLGQGLARIQLIVGRYNAIIGITRVFNMLQEEELNQLLAFNIIEILVQFALLDNQ